MKREPNLIRPVIKAETSFNDSGTIAEDAKDSTCHGCVDAANFSAPCHFNPSTYLRLQPKRNICFGAFCRPFALKLL